MSHQIEETILKKVPQVSIGMPVYNGEKFIRHALDSLLSQTFTDFELLISDNGSTDGTEAICQEYRDMDTRISYVRHPKNMGPSMNYRFVLEKTVGNYFMWAASDDKWEKNWIEELLGAIKLEYAGVRGAIAFFNESGSYKMVPTSFLKGAHVKYFMEDDSLAKCHHIYGLFHRKKLLDSNLSILNARYASDVAFVCHLLSFGDLVTIESTTHFYRLHDSNIGAEQVEKFHNWRRLVYRIQPLEYYLLNIKAIPYPFKICLLVLIPIKHIKAQTALWGRGFYKLIYIPLILKMQRKK